MRRGVQVIAGQRDVLDGTALHPASGRWDFAQHIEILTLLDPDRLGREDPENTPIVNDGLLRCDGVLEDGLAGRRPPRRRVRAGVTGDRLLQISLLPKMPGLRNALLTHRESWGVRRTNTSQATACRTV